MARQARFRPPEGCLGPKGAPTATRALSPTGNAGINPKVVQERLGHSKVTITLDIYSHVMPTMQEEAADRVATMIFGEAR